MSNVEVLRQHLMRLYREHLAAKMIPTSGRFLFYELIQQEIVPKQASGVLRPGAKGQRRADQNMTDALTDLRERGQIPWDAIVDETRWLDDFTGSESIFADALAYMNEFRIDPWGGAAPLVLTESRSLAGVLRVLLREHRALIAPTNGQCNGFLRTKVAPRLLDLHESGGRKPRVLYLGDFDLAANDIEDHTRGVLEEYCSLEWERLALTDVQVRDPRYRLTPIVKHDKRFKDDGAHEAVETEALSQSVIVQIVRDRLTALLPEPLAAVHEREEAQRERLRRLLREGAMSVTRMLRDRLADIEAQGLTIVGLRYGRHMKIDIAAPDGRVMMLILSKTPSDHRAAAKVRSQLRRFARQGATP